jgi:ComF family protein
MRNFIRFATLFREYVFPLGCAICGDALLDGNEAWYGLCRFCRTYFEIEGGERCLSCGRPLISELGRCLSCRDGEGFSFDGAFVLWPYTGNYRKLLTAYKFRKILTLGNFFAQKMLDALPLFPAFVRGGLPRAGDFSWVPVPPRPGKIKNSGWDQIDWLAGKLRKNHGVRVEACLKRLPSQTQKKLDREARRVNLRGRVRCRKPPPEKVLLFDDVITTGSTLDACAKALKNAGAKEVFALSLFYD